MRHDRGSYRQPLTPIRARHRLYLLAEMQSLGYSLYRNTLKRKNPEATREEIDGMFDAYLGGEPQERDVIPGTVLRSPRRSSIT